MGDFDNKFVNGKSLASFANKTKEYIDDTCAPKASPSFTSSISMGRKSGTGIGFNSVAVGSDVTASGSRSQAVGYNTTASGNYSHAEGTWTVASAHSSHAEGSGSQATGNYSHAEGNTTIASGLYSHSEGTTTEAKGENSHAEGWNTIARGIHQHVQGKYNIEDTENAYAHIVGNGAGGSSRSNAHTLDWNGNAWFAGDVKVGADKKVLATKEYVDDSRLFVTLAYEEIEGESVPVLSSHSSTEIIAAIAEGKNVIVDGAQCTVFESSSGKVVVSLLGSYSDTTAHINLILTIDTDKSVEIQMQMVYNTGYVDYLEAVINTKADIEHASETTEHGTSSSTKYGHAMASSTTPKAAGTANAGLETAKFARGDHVHPAQTTITGNAGTATKLQNGRTITIGNTGKTFDGSANVSWSLSEIGIDTDNLVITNSISMGRTEDTTIGAGSTAVGYDVTASGECSHAEGANNTASGDASHAEGSLTEASGTFSHVEGFLSEASGQCSHAEGCGTVAASECQHVQGQFNIEDSANTYAHIVGNGIATVPSNAHTLDWNGNAWFAGTVKVGADNKELATTDHTHTKAEIEAKLTGLVGSHHHDYTNVKTPSNTITSTSDDTVSNWGYHCNSVHWFTQNNCLIDQPNQWGFLQNYSTGGAEVHQLWFTQASGSIYHRGGNASGWSGSWREILDSSNFKNLVTPSAIGAFSTTGGTIEGDVSINGDLDMNGSISANYVSFSNIMDVYPHNDEELGNRTASPGFGTIYCKYDTGETNVTSYADGYLSASYVDWLEFYGTETRWYRDYIVTTGNFVPYVSNTYTLGYSSLRWKTIYSNNSLNTSDREEKENIVYIRDNDKAETVSEISDITYNSLYNFVRDDLELATYNLKCDEEKPDINFIAQDLLYNIDGTDNTIGQIIVPPIPAPTDEEAQKYEEVDENGNKTCSPPTLSYDLGNYVSVLAGALKESINKIEKQQETIDYLLSIIENK